MESSGITYSPDFELVNIAHSDHLSLDEFLKKPEWYQGLITAHYRGKNQIEAVLNHNSEIEMEQKRIENEAKRKGTM